MMRLFILLTLVFLGSGLTYAQQPHDKGVFIDYQNEFYDEIEKECAKFKSKETAPSLTFKVDFSGCEIPKSTTEFISFWHTPSVSQGNAGTCWCFAATSFFESEVYRLHKKEIKLSQLYTVYWEYVEKARRFVRQRGDSVFDEGSQSNAVMRMWQKYGIVPLASYSGFKPNQKFHDHSDMAAEMRNFLNSVKQNNMWNEGFVIATIKNILNNYLGEPPVTITVDNQPMTPLEYFHNVVKLNPDDYVDIMSLLQKPYYKQAEYEVPDNWWHGDQYYNAPLDEFMNAIKSSIRKGYTMTIGGDVSEPGIEGHLNVAIIPSFDIPSAYIDEYARQFRFSNKSTTDDHGVHLVGYLEKNGVTWFLIKDSASGCRNGKNPGYYFYHEDFVKLKMMNFMLHKAAVEELLKKFNK